LTDDSRYAGRAVPGRAVKDRDGVWNLLAFENYIDAGFVGRLCDPEPLMSLVERAFGRSM
jgi:hypothetical protein